MEQLKNKKSHAEPASMPLEINSIQDILRWIFIESSAKWLFMILLFEYIVAVNLSPTILTDYPLFNWVVEKLSFIPAVHNFDDIAVHPEAVRFYIALAFILLIPKAISIYYFLVKNPITGMATYVITPYTTTKPDSTRRMFSDSWQDEENATVGEQKPRSMFSRIFWSMMILALTMGAIWVFVFTDFGHGDFSSFLKKSDANIANGGITLWYEFSINNMGISGLLIAISAFVIKDYIRYFIALFRRFL